MSGKDRNHPVQHAGDVAPSSPSECLGSMQHALVAWFSDWGQPPILPFLLLYGEGAIAHWGTRE
eukprot:3269112-Amphidinium_carterae.1